jgi:hypothetical protein
MQGSEAGNPGLRANPSHGRTGAAPPKGANMDDGPGKRFVLKAAALFIGCAVLVVLGWLVISSVFLRFGFIAAVVVVFAAAGLVAHHFDTKSRRQYTDGT